MASEGRHAGGYEVALPGAFGPAYRAAFCAMGAQWSDVSTRFVLHAPEGTGVCEIAAMLQARGLVILDIRRVPGPVVAAPASVSG